MNSSNNSKGVLAGILAVVIVAAIVVVAWMYYKDDSANNTQESADSNTASDNRVSVRPQDSTTDLAVMAPTGWTVDAASKDTLTKEIDGTRFNIQFLMLPANEDRGMLAEYESAESRVRATVEGSADKTFYLVETTGPNDISVRTCEDTANATCYVQHDGANMLILLYNSVPNQQNYAGLKDMSSASTTRALDDLKSILKQL